MQPFSPPNWPPAACDGVTFLPASPLAESLGAAATRADRGRLSCRFAAAGPCRGSQRQLLVEDPQGQVGGPLERQLTPGDALLVEPGGRNSGMDGAIVDRYRPMLDAAAARRIALASIAISVPRFIACFAARLTAAT